MPPSENGKTLAMQLAVFANPDCAQKGSVFSERFGAERAEVFSDDEFRLTDAFRAEAGDDFSHFWRAAGDQEDFVPRAWCAVLDF